MSEEVTGSEAANEGIEGAVGNAKEFAGDVGGNVKEFFSGDVAENAKEFAGDVAGNVKGFGAKIAGFFKGSN